MTQPNESPRPLILLTNDDGFFAEGIEKLYAALQGWGDVFIVAPDRERSAASQALTLHHPLRAHKVKDRVFSVDGTPADCVYLALQALLPRKPDLIVSGINPGPNVGRQDVSYSGTVAGAVQGGYLGIPSIAASLIPDRQKNCHFDFTGGIVRRLASGLLARALPPGTVLNLNVPAPPLAGIRTAELGEKHYQPEVLLRRDPRGRDYYWIGTGSPRAVGSPNSDVHLTEEGFATVTPLHRDLTDRDTLERQDLHHIIRDIEHEMAPKTV